MRSQQSTVNHNRILRYLTGELHTVWPMANMPCCKVTHDDGDLCVVVVALQDPDTAIQIVEGEGYA